MQSAAACYLILLLSALSCASPKPAVVVATAPAQEERYYTLTEFDDLASLEAADVPKRVASYKLAPLTPSESYVRIDVYRRMEQAAHSGKPVYKQLLEVRGKAGREPGFVIYAEWKLSDPAKVPAFQDSRRELFQLRQELLDDFSFDVLTQNLTHPDQYLILGFYKSEDGLEQARNHPKIKEWAVNNGPASFSATDLFVPKRLKIFE